MHVEDYAIEMVGNWKSFDSFVWASSAQPDDSNKCCRIFLRHRDSDLLTISNAECIKRDLDKYIGSLSHDSDAAVEQVSCWAYGWREELVIRVYDKQGNVTQAFCAYAEIAFALADYPVLDEWDFSDREHEACLDAIEQQGKSIVSDDAPDSWVGEVHQWLDEHDSGQLENHGGNGAWPSKDSVREALTELGYLESDDDV